MTEFEKIKSDADNYIMNTYARYNIALASGKGATAKDVEGKTYIDFGSGIGVNALGYADEGWIEAVSRQLRRLSHMSNLYYSPSQAELARLLCGVTGFSRVFFCNSGAEANEGMIKLARKYSFDKYGKGRATIITLKNSFHGRTVTTLAATGQEAFHNYFFPFTEGFKYVEPNDFEALLAAATPDVCGVMLEAVQGEGGVYPLDRDYVAKAAALAKERDILLMFDEVQTGIGRTGRFFGFEHFGVSPDVVSCAKGIGGGLPLGAVLCSGRLRDVLGPSAHGSTFGGNPVACAGAVEVVSRVSRPEFLAEVAKKGAYIRQKLMGLEGIGEIRGMGLMIGFEIDGVDSKAAALKAAEKGLLILTAKKALRMLPPLVITYEEIDAGLQILYRAVAELKGQKA